MLPSAPARARTEMSGLGVVASFSVPISDALSAPLAWISRLAVNDLICWDCCAASESADIDGPVAVDPTWCEPPGEALVMLPGLQPATVTAAATATAAKPDRKSTRLNSSH